ncbi:spartin a isoform X1 [Centroberyx gerrardi]|uniref:spartin a isoform X1 n=1 Tax=Centroberyx gerrardi TaxID=166262 RepID=UPI003AABF004
MAEPAELLLIKDQYELAFHCLSRGLAAEEAGKRPEALEHYKKGRQHLTQGLEVPSGGEKQQGAAWDTARQLQQKMRDTLRTVSTHLTDLETAELPTEGQGGRVLMELPLHLYPALAPNMQPPHSTLHHLYPTLPATIQTTLPIPTSAPIRPAPPGAPHTYRLPSEVTVPSLPTQPLLPLALPGDQPPAYTPQPTEGHHSLAYSPAAGGLGLGEQIGAAAAAGGGDGEELLFIPSGVQMFFVTPDGQVSSLFYPGYLRIITFNGQRKDSAAGRPSAFLHVCDWLYPLTTDTPVLLANSGIFMFPDTVAETPGSYVGIVLSSELPAADREMFQDLLSHLAELRVQAPVEGAGSEVINLSEKVPLGPPREETGFTVATGGKEKPPLPEWSEKMAQGILSGATRLSQGFVKGAEATGRAIQRGASKLRDHITPENTPAEVSPRVTKGLQVAKQATGGAVRVSQFLVNGVSTVAGCVGEKLAPHVKKHGAKLIPESMKKSKDGRASNLDGAKLVAASSVQGLSTMWTGLETGAKNVGKSVASETVTTVKYKYGDEAGRATDTAVQSVINVGVTAYNIDNLGVKAILKTAGKKTAKAMVKDKDMENGQPAETEGKEIKKEEEEEKKE